MSQIRKKQSRRGVGSVWIAALAALCAVVFSCLFLAPGKTGPNVAVRAAEAPAQTYMIHSAQDFIDYSRAYAVGERNKNDVLNISINEGSTVTDDGFISIGTSSNPFSGTINIPSAGVDVFHLFDCPLFDYVSTDLRFTGAGTVKIMRERANETPADGVLTSGALFANHVVAGTNAASWNVALLPYDGEGLESTGYKGLIGDIAAGADVTVNFTNTSTIPVIGTANTGLICGTLNAGASLAVTTAGSGSALTVTTSGGHAGGLVGEMKNGSTLKLKSANNTRVNSVTASNGYSGGLVGYADRVTLLLDGVTDYAVSGSVSGKTGAGGLFGYYKNALASATFDLQDTFALASGLSVSSAGYTGGVFGLLVNEGASFTFDGNSASESIAVTLPGGNYRGGVCGAYQTNALTNTFEILDTATTVTAAQTSNKISAGLVGQITDSAAAYVKIHDVSCTSGGTPDAGLVGSVGAAGSFVDVTGNVAVSGTFDAGMIYSMQSGVLRMKGLCDFSAYTRGSSASAYFVKNRNRALIYALGDGAGTDGDWTFKRNVSQSIDDVHSWGEVIRTDGSILSESDLFTPDMVAHTVTVKGVETIDDIDTVVKFAKIALNMKLNTGAGVGALQFTSGSANLASTLNAATLTLGADIDLSGTGILGLQRDDGYLTNWGSASTEAAFTGTFDGNGNTITLAIGENYGLQGDGSALAADSKQGNIYQHSFNGLFARISGAAAKVNDLTVDGDILLFQTADGMRAGGVAAAVGKTLTLDKVTASESIRFRTGGDYTAYVGGAIGMASGSNLNVSIEECALAPAFTETSESSVGGDTNTYVGGAVGYLYESVSSSYAQSVSFSDTTLGLTYDKTGAANRLSNFGAAIAGVSPATYVKDRRTVSFDNVNVNITASGKAKNRKFGAILGTEWFASDVTLDGVTVTSASITAASGSVADYGGMVRTATGHWDVKDLSVTAANFNVPSGNGSTFGFLVNKTFYSSEDVKNALYVDVDNVGSHYDIAAVTFTGDPAFASFDEIAADSRFNGADVTSNGNSVVSIKTSGNVINTSGSVNTYLNKTAYGKTDSAAKKINPNTRYYYNLDTARANTATAKYNFLIWSVKTYAHSSLADWFASTSTFTGDLDMTGLSYYPVDVTEGVTFSSATLKLDNNLMETWVKPAYTGESGSRTTRSATNQHYLMHTAAFRNDPSSTVSISGLTIQGNVPKISDSFCGFLIAGTLGNDERNNVKFNASNIVFDGAYISNAGSYFTDTTYAPLLINKVGKNTTLNIAGAAQSTTAYASYAGNGYYAASSLIGNVGDTTARAVYLTFTGLKFDGRSSASSIGNLDTAYGTTKSIFSRATILNSFKYFSESSGSYNYTVDEDWTNSSSPAHNVTYGREITSSAAEFYDLQSKYLSSEYYTDPVNYHAGSASDFSSGWLPHVYVGYNSALYQHELSVNVSFTSEIEGCGKYGDPYIIDDDTKLGLISMIIRGDNVGDTTKIWLPNDLTSCDYVKTNYTKYKYSFGSTNFTPVSGGSSQTNANARKWLAGAYYVITRDITLSGTNSASEYVPLGEGSDATYTFRGVIMGRGNPVITNHSRKPLIYNAMGCVVKDLTIDVDVNYESSSNIDLPAPLGNGTYALSGGNNAYGAVIQQIMGGDNIIDNVDVTFTSAAFNITAASGSNYPRLVPVGGYVGVLVNGGLVFRNMPASYKGLTNAAFNKISDAGYLYVNPIIGRVIAGYAFHETATASAVSATMDNGSKNYRLADVSPSGGKITVTDASSTYTVSVPDGQALFLLSAAVNSGACAAATGGNLTDNITQYQTLTAFWQAYRAYTEVRAGATYDDVGTASGDDFELAKKDKYSAGNRKGIPYILRAYTTDDNSCLYLRSLTGSGRSNTILRITGNCDISAGFRGIGSHFYDNDYLRLRVSQVTGWNAGTSAAVSRTLTFHMDVREYEQTSVSSYVTAANTAGLGLFNVLKMSGVDDTDTTSAVRKLELSGRIFHDLYTISGTQSLYNYSITVNGKETNTVNSHNYISVGGIAGLINTARYRIEDVTFNGLSVEGAKMAGGLVGYVNLLSVANSSFITYSAGTTNAGAVNAVGGLVAGGLIGRVYEGRTEIYGATGGTDIIVGNIEVKASALNDVGLYITGQYVNNLSTGAGGLIGNVFAHHKGSSGTETDRLRNGNVSGTAAKRTYIDDINVVKGTGDANIRVRNGGAVTDINAAGGMIGTCLNTILKVNRCKILNVSVRANIAGGVLGLSAQKAYYHFDDITVDGTDKSAAIRGNAIAGGVIGRFRARDGVFSDINHATVTYYTIESLSTLGTASCAAGGILGDANGNTLLVTSGASNPFEFRNTAVSHCIIRTQYASGNNNCGTGGLIGVATPGMKSDTNSAVDYTKKVKIAGYNTFLDDLTLVHLNGGAADQSTSATNRNIGDIIGNNSASTGIKLVGVTTSNMTYCGKHAGYYNSTADNYGDGGEGFGTGFVVFADWDGVQTNESFAAIDDGGSDADDYSDVVNSFPYVTSNPSLTVNGTLLTSDGVADSIDNLAIQDILANGTSGRYAYAASGYYEGSSGDTNYAAFNAYSSKLVMFSSEVSGYLGTDFPVLLVDDTTRANTTKMINSYIRLLTNTTEDYGTDAAGKFEVQIYNVAYDNGVFTPSAVGASLKREGGQFYMLNNTFDSGKTQFSLIDVRFFDPVVNADTAYHLYIPVFVKKVLSYRFDIAELSGTNYLRTLYTSRYGQALIENTGTPITLFFQYTYSRTNAEWAEAINAGEDVDRNYEKNLLFYKANTNDILEDFPDETILVLVDPNNGGREYYASFEDAMTGTTLNLSAFKSVMTPDGAGGYTFSGDSFTPKNLSELMTLSAAADPSGTMVRCAAGDATVTVSGQGYRLATDEEMADGGATTKYTVSVSAMETERYYLSIYTESNAVNDELFHYYLITTPSSFSDPLHPSKITDTDAHTMVHLVMGKIFHHSDLDVTTNSSTGSPIMTAGNNLLCVDMTAEFGLSDDLDSDIKPDIQNLISATNVYQSFLVYLNRKENLEIRKEILGTPDAAGSYNADYVLNGAADTATTAYTGGSIRATQNYAEFVTGDLSAYFASGNHFEINSSITLTYSADAIPTQFPGRGELPPSDSNGVTVSANSNIAFQQEATTYSKNTISKDETPARSYYSETAPEVATLDLNPIGDRVGDFTPLGINASNNNSATVANFDLLADLNVGPIADRIADYTDAQVTIQLAQKQADGSYGAPLNISQYMTIDFEGLTGITHDSTTYTQIVARSALTENTAVIEFPIIHCHVLTGSALESAGFTYGNYRITVTVVLRASGVKYSISQASNYVIYTNARIIPEYLS